MSRFAVVFSILAPLLLYRCAHHTTSLSIRDQMLQYAEQGKANLFEDLIKHNPDSTSWYMQTNGCVILQKAAEGGNIVIAKMVLEYQVPINCDMNNALFYACAMGRADMVRFLFQQGAQMEPNGFGASTCLHVAAGTNARWWVEQAKYDFTPIDHLTVMKILMEHGADINATDRFGETPMHKAVSVQNYEIIEYLIAHNADINSRDMNGSTPLHKATSTNKDNSVCALLLEHGARAVVRDNRGMSPILSGYNNIDTSTIRLFVRYGYDPVKDVDENGSTLLHRALSSGQFSTVYYLLDHKINVNTSTKRGTTPLHIAAGLHGATGLQVIQRLLDAGADINAIDMFGRTPLSGISKISESDHGTYYPDTLIVNYLIRRGARE